MHANVVNHGLVDNLPAGCVVEVPTLVDGNGVHPVPMGSLPVQAAALNRPYVSVAELTVEAARTGDPRLVRQAVLMDPNASSTLTRRGLADVRRPRPGPRGPAARTPARDGVPDRALTRESEGAHRAPHPQNRPVRRATLGFLPVLGGCGREEVTVLDTDAEVQLVFWSGQSDDAATVLQGLVDEFQRLHPNVHLDMSPGASSTEELLQKLAASFAADEAPDISYTFGSWASQLERSGRTLDVTAVVADPEVRWEEFTQAARDTARPRPAHDRVPRRRRQHLAVLQHHGLRPGRRRAPHARLELAGLPHRGQGPHRPGDEHLRVRLLGLGQRGDDLAAVAAPVAERRGVLDGTTGRSAFQSAAGVEALEFLRAMAVDDRSVYLDQTTRSSRSCSPATAWP